MHTLPFWLWLSLLAGDQAAAKPERVTVDAQTAAMPRIAPQSLKLVSVPAVIRERAATYVDKPSLSAQQRSELRWEEPVSRQRRPGSRGLGFPAPASVGPSAKSKADGITVPPEGALAPALGTNFDTTNFDTNVTNTGFVFIPADASGAAGPNHLVNVVNTTIRVHDKSGALLLDSALDDFFAGEGPLTETFDPKVIFDQYAGRFVVVTLEFTDVGFGDPSNTSRIFLAVSETADPTGTWYTTAIDSKIFLSGADHWADYPGFAVDEEAVYVTANMFDFAAAGDFTGDGARVWVVAKDLDASGFYDGGSAAVTVLDPYASAGLFTTTQPAHTFGAAAKEQGMFLVSYSGLSNDPPASDPEFVQIIELDDPLGSPVFTQQFVNIGNIENPVAALPSAPQKDETVQKIATNDRRALNAVWLDDVLVMTATINPVSGDDSGDATAHWWELNTANPTVALLDQGNIGGEDIASTTFTYFPSAAINGAGQIAVGYSASAATQYAGSYYTTHEAATAAGANTGSGTLRSGTASYRRTFSSGCSGTVSRWGDYSGMAVDPVDGCFWVYNKHAIAQGTGTDCNGGGADEFGRWGTAWGRFCPTDACAADVVLDDLTLSGTQTRGAASTLLALNSTVPSGANVTFEAADQVALRGGFGVATGGTFTVTMTNGCP